MMTHTWGRLIAVVVALAVVLALVGCSGAGLAPGAVTNASVQTLAQDQMTMVALVRGWLKMLYGAVTPPIIPTTDYEVLEDGTFRVFGLDGWGRPYEYFLLPDGSGHGTFIFGERGQTVNGVWSAPSGWPIIVQHVRYEFTDMTLEYDFSGDYSGGGMAPTVEDGTMTLPDGREAHFRYDHNAVDLDKLRVQIPAAGVDIQMEIPAHYVDTGVSTDWKPLAASRATGTVRVAGREAQFEIRGDNAVWQKLNMGDGTRTGTFALGADMTGSGQFMENGALAGAFNWPADLTGRLDLTSLESVEVSPLSAARDFAVDKWISSIANLSPGSIQ